MSLLVCTNGRACSYMDECPYFDEFDLDGMEGLREDKDILGDVNSLKHTEYQQLFSYHSLFSG